MPPRRDKDCITNLLDYYERLVFRLLEVWEESLIAELWTVDGVGEFPKLVSESLFIAGTVEGPLLPPADVYRPTE